ncbi:MAG: hypothetical protein ACK5M1_09780 [Xanthomarina gelatinilytica]|uniref:hypothetical protein n=1 Tax=Xanthomarina gelatinilytica TaxID=1137281 RepID=UPI003A83BF03
MKTLKINILAILGLLLVTGCSKDIEDYDTVAEIHDEAGATVQVSTTSNSSILGNPEPGIPLDEALVTVTNAYLDLTVRLTTGNLDQIEKIEIVKSFTRSIEGDEINTDEIVLASTTTLPYNLVVGDIEDLVSGIGVNSDELKIGDVFTFRTKVTQTDGNIYYYNSGMGTTSLIVNCASDLAGVYTNPYLPQAVVCNGPTATVTEVSPGRYWVSSMTGYSFGAGGCIGFYILDVCGQLKYDGGDLEDNGYSGEGGFGQVNADGSFTMTLFLNDVGYSQTSTYTPI